MNHTSYSNDMMVIAIISHFLALSSQTHYTSTLRIPLIIQRRESKGRRLPYYLSHSTCPSLYPQRLGCILPGYQGDWSKWCSGDLRYLWFSAPTTTQLDGENNVERVKGCVCPSYVECRFHNCHPCIPHTIIPYPLQCLESNPLLQLVLE